MLNNIVIKTIFNKCVNDMNELITKYKDKNVTTIIMSEISLLIEDYDELDDTKHNKYSQWMGYCTQDYECDYDDNDNLINEHLQGKTVISINKDFCEDKTVIYNVLAHELCHYLTGKITSQYHWSFDTDSSVMFCVVVRFFNNNGFNIEMNNKLEKQFAKYQPWLCKYMDSANDFFPCVESIVKDVAKKIIYSVELLNNTIGHNVQELIEHKYIYYLFEGNSWNTLVKKDKSSIRFRLGLDIDLKNFDVFIKDKIENAKEYKNVGL